MRSPRCALLGPRLCLGPQCPRGSASLKYQLTCHAPGSGPAARCARWQQTTGASARRSLAALRSQAEPGTEVQCASLPSFPVLAAHMLFRIARVVPLHRMPEDTVERVLV